MSKGYEIPLDQARVMCDEVLDLLGDTVTRAEYAGSVKRQQNQCGDLEVIVACSDAAIDDRCDALMQTGVFSLRYNKRGHQIAYSNRQKAVWFNDMPLDIWIVRPDRYWGPTAVLRTGPKELNQMLVTPRGMKTRDGLPGICPPDLVWRDGALWRLPSRYEADNYDSNNPLPQGSVRQYTPEEMDVFAILGLPYTEPTSRRVAVYELFRELHVPIQKVRPNHTITIATGRINADDQDLLDITVGAIEAGRATPAGIVLAPRREWVTWLKTKKISEASYTECFLEEMRWRWTWNPQGFLNILNRNRVVLACYCAAGEFCHRHLAKDVLIKLAQHYGIGVIDEGELVLQHSLFEMMET